MWCFGRLHFGVLRLPFEWQQQSWYLSWFSKKIRDGKSFGMKWKMMTKYGKIVPNRFAMSSLLVSTDIYTANINGSLDIFI